MMDEFLAQIEELERESEQALRDGKPEYYIYLTAMVRGMKKGLIQGHKDCLCDMEEPFAEKEDEGEPKSEEATETEGICALSGFEQYIPAKNKIVEGEVPTLREMCYNARKTVGMKQSSFGAMIGVSASEISHIEHGHIPTVVIQNAIHRIYFREVCGIE